MVFKTQFRTNKFKYYSILILFLFGLKGFSQSQKTYFIPDSLKNKSYKYIYKQHNISSNKRDTIKMLFYAKMYLHKGKNENDTIRIANAYTQFSSSANSSKLSLTYADSIIHLTKNINHHNFPAYGYIYRGNEYYNLLNFKKSLDNYLIASKYALKNDNKRQLYYINNGIASIKRLFGDYNEVKIILKSQLEYLKENKEVNNTLDNRNYFSTLYKLSSAYIQLKELDSALFIVNKELQKGLKEKDEYFYYNYVKLTGSILLKKKEYLRALDSINKASIINETPIQYLSTNYNKGRVYNGLNKKNKALFFFKKADSVFDKNPNIILPVVINLQEYFLKYYIDKKDNPNQLKYIDRLLRADSIMDSQKKDFNEAITKEYDRPKLLAEKQSIINNLENKKIKSRILIGSLIAGLLVLLGFTIRFYYLQSIYKKRFKDLVNNNETEEIIIKPKEPLQGISQDIITTILKQLEQLEKDDLFLDQNITLTSLAKSYSTNSSYLSKVINHYKQKSFSAYLTSLRIEYAISKLKTDKVLRGYTIKAIANDMGFKNSESFSKAFFKKAGIYPSFFIKQIEKLNNVA